MYERLLKPPSTSCFLFGPRGTGKTTWIKKTFPDAIHLDLLESKLFNAFVSAPERLEEQIPVGYDGWVVIDEVQRVPELLNEVHRLIETRRLRFVLTGSSARKVRRAGVNLLAGRARLLEMFPLVSAELGGDFSIERALARGLLPLSYLAEDCAGFLQSYVETYLRQEVLQEGLVRNLGSFARFLEAASFSQGQPLNVSAVARECGVTRTVAQGYFEILGDLLIGATLPSFRKRARRRLVAAPKFYYFDAGVYRAIRPTGPLDRPEEIDGAALETLVWQELRASNALHQLGWDLSYWRTSNQLEVDFILYGARGITAIEVKRTGAPRAGDLSGLRAFAADYREARTILLYGGTRILSRGSIEIVPLARFFETPLDYIS
jgi:predicted AAA+ superfamily ATPase